MKILTATLALLLIGSGAALAEKQTDHGQQNPGGGIGTYNNDNWNGTTPAGGNNCAGGGCGVDGGYHAKGFSWPGQGDGKGTK